MKNQILRLFFSSDLHLGFNTVSIDKTTPKKIGALMYSLKMLSPCKSTIRNILLRITVLMLLIFVLISWMNL